ncbi:patatin-like phospholipase family protein [Lysobacter koreensis]|uniref:Patatin-like phospholipase family protein n=1 Tax=Lysobacter koreensis TaxID=266122 RepID=A0ABW2YL51_9GAMM
MAADAPKIARGERVALVLGAGGARGLAQIGVIEALQARGLNIVAVAGSSSGALVGGLFAAGKLGAYRDWLFGLSRTDMLRLLDPVFGSAALFRGHRLMQALRELTGHVRIEELPVDFTAVAVDLLRQREVWLREGDLWDAVRASIAIPGLFTPYEVHGRELVDGGLLAPLPIAATRLSDAHRLIAVDMHGWPQRPPGSPAEPGREDAREAPSRSRLGEWFERRLHRDAQAAEADGPVQHPPVGFTELMARSLDTMQAQIARVQLALDPPELVIRIPRDACQFYEFWRAKELIQIGRAEADKALDAAGY